MNKKIYIVAIILLIGLSLVAQINIKVGYTYDRSDSEVVSSMISTYNTENPNLEVPLEQIVGRSGLTVGVRYRISRLGIELSMSRLTGDKEALGGSLNAGFTDKISSSILSYGLGLENHFGMVGIGAALGIQKQKYKRKISGTNRFRDFLDEGNRYCKLYLSFDFPSDNIAFAIKPYYQYSIGSINLSDFKNEIAPSSLLTVDQLTIYHNSFGIS